MADPNKPRRQSFLHKPRKEMRFGPYSLGSTLGEGEFGKVILGWRRDEKQPSQVAIKFIRRDTIPKGSERESKVRREINALKTLSHPNIIRLDDVCQNDKYIGIVLDYVSGGELFDYILQNRYLKDSMACRLFAQLVSGVFYMHSKGIVHRDLKLENLLLDKHKNVIITDFGFVNKFSDGNELMKTSCGSPCYAAPELVISNEPYEARKADVWSCGIILYAMLAGYLPFDDDPQNPDGDNISRLYQYITTTNLTFPEYVEPIPRDLLRRILVSNPRRRIGLKEVRSHQWLSQHAPFLSITPAEWDINKKSSRTSKRSQQERTKNDQYRRYSLIEPSTKQQMIPNPLPPQTSSSHAMAIPSSTSSTSIDELAFRKAHQRSNSVQSYSSASLALQAVVDADEVRAQQQLYPQQQQDQGHLPSSSSLYNVDRAGRPGSVSPKLPHQQLYQPGIPRSTTHTGISGLSEMREQLTNYTIEESPVKKDPQELVNRHDQNDGFIKPKAPISTHKFSNPVNQKLPGPAGGRKQRPTSFHPGLYSTSNATPTNVGHEPISLSEPNFTRPFSRSDSINSVTSLSNGNNISQPSVDLASAEGDIITPRSPNLVSPKLYVPQHEKRADEAFMTVNSNQAGEKLKEMDPQQENVNDLETVTSQQKKSNRYSALIAAEMVYDKIFGSTQEALPIETKNILPIEGKKSKVELSKLNIQLSNSRPVVNSSSNTKSTFVNNTVNYANEQRKPMQRPSSAVFSTSNSNNQNTQKNKRFSFLSFYNGSSQQSDIEIMLPEAQPLKKKVLEPSNVNIVGGRKVSTNSDRITYTSFAPKKEPSTAKKVMDFFKRRSTRVG